MSVTGSLAPRIVPALHHADDLHGRSRAVGKIAICVATCRRPVMLSQLLRSLAALQVDPDIAAELFVVIVDNDAAASAGPVVEAARRFLPWPLLSAVEPVRNISLARNLGVRLALAAGAEWVAFIDDDELATPGWIAELVRVQREHGADVVAGPVEPRFSPDIPEWVVRGGFFARPRQAPGTPARVAETSNSLVSARLLAAIEGPFDPAFGLAGGGDSHFFLRARRGGATIVWADAPVAETIPRSRARAGWILRRAFRVGNCGAFAERGAAPVAAWLPRRAALSVARVVAGAGLLIPAALRGRAAAVRMLWRICLGAGALAALAGFRYVEYEGLHGE
jgi:glycosyltransferase involved in cell wall biosynthesis